MSLAITDHSDLMGRSSLHVALVTTQSTWSGGEVQALQLMQGLRAAGHRVTCFASRNSHVASRMVVAGFPICEFDGRGRSPRAVAQLRRALRAARPDVIHLNDPHAVTAAGLAMLGLPSPPRVAARRVDFSLGFPARYRWWTDRVICVSHAVANICQASGLPSSLVRVVHDGGDPERVAQGDRDRGRDRLRIAPNHFALLTVARLAEHKGHRYLIEAMASLVRQHPYLRLLLAGDGELRGQLERQVSQLGLSESVQFLGFRSDIPDLLHAADLFVMPSCTEGLCSSIIDAMLARCPVVATRAGGIPDLLDHHDGSPAVGELVPPCTADGLAAAIDRLVVRPRYRHQLVGRAEVRARRRFTVDAMVRDTLSVYDEILPRCSNRTDLVRGIGEPMYNR